MLQRFVQIQWNFVSIREACLTHGLLHDDREWKWCLEEGKLLCSLFIIVVHDCNPMLPMDLWNEFKSFICDDLQQQLTCHGIPDASPDLIFDYGLYLIESTLQNDSNKTMKDIGMAVPTHNWKALLSNSFMQDHYVLILLTNLSSCSQTYQCLM